MHYVINEAHDLKLTYFPEASAAPSELKRSRRAECWGCFSSPEEFIEARVAVFGKGVGKCVSYEPLSALVQRGSDFRSLERRWAAAAPGAHS